MKHTHTHPNWKNLTTAQKQVVRKRNHAAASNQRMIKELEERLSPGCFDEENIKYMLYKRKHPDYDPLLRSIKGSSPMDDLSAQVLAAFNQYAKDIGR